MNETIIGTTPAEEFAFLRHLEAIVAYMTVQKAQKMLEERIAELQQQYETALEAKDILFLTFMRSWLDDVIAHRVKANTLSQYNLVYNGYIAKFMPFHGVTLRELTPALVQSYYNAQLKAGLSPNTVRKHHANIHKCLDYAVRLGLMTRNPSVQTELPLNPDFVTHHFQRILKANGLPVIRFHDLRHSAVYALRKGGCDAKDVQSWLGHSDVSTTLNVYGHLLAGDLVKLGQIMDSMVG